MSNRLPVHLRARYAPVARQMRHEKGPDLFEVRPFWVRNCTSRLIPGGALGGQLEEPVRQQHHGKTGNERQVRQDASLARSHVVG